jgi:hypothetical protein
VALIIALIAVGAFGVTFVSVRGWIQHQARSR